MVVCHAVSVYTVSGTELGYGATRYDHCISFVAEHKVLTVVISPNAGAVQCPVLTYRMGMSAYAPAMRCPVLSSRMLLPGDNAPPIESVFSWGRGEEGRYHPTLSGTDIAHAAITLRGPYGMSGTELAYAAIGLRARCTMVGTDRAYGPRATRAR
eukprot:1013808-Rhodomonas_salina.6